MAEASQAEEAGTARQVSQSSRCLSIADVLEDELAGKILRDEERQALGGDIGRLRTLRTRLHAAKRSALCLSGGGIRSATFGLGVLQSLARHKILPQFDYLSTVSGGGYIGGWLSAWIRNAGGIDEVVKGLDKDLRKAEGDQADPEAEPIRHLRTYSNYLTPKLGFFSSDTWTIIATVVRNIFLNWLMLIPIIAFVLTIPRVFASLAIRCAPPLGVITYAIAVAVFYAIMATAYATLDLPAFRVPNKSKTESHLTDGGFAWFELVPLILASWLLSLAWFWLRYSYPAVADSFANWTSATGAWSWVYLSLGTSLPGGAFAMLLRRKPMLGMWKELAAVLGTCLVGGAALWWVFSSLFSDLAPYNFDAAVINYVCFAPPLVLLVFLLMNFTYVFTLSRSTTPEDREWWARAAGWLLITILATAAINCIVIWGPIGLHYLLQDKSWVKKVVAALGGVTGIVTALLGHSSRTAAEKKEGAPPFSWLAVGAMAFLVFLLVCVSLATSWLIANLFGISTATPPPTGMLKYADYRAFYSTVVLQSEVWTILPLAAIFFFTAVVMGYLVNVNLFSLHAMYSARLTRAYLGASRTGCGRKPHWFTGFDANDEVSIWKLSHERKLFHVVNIALNLVSGKELAWQERKAQSFTVSPLHAGSWGLGYRPAQFYDGGMGLGTAMTISGAAANPNMGYHSSPLVAILMTLFNVRLGWWAGNPGPHGNNSWYKKGPKHAALPLLAEAFGYTTDEFRVVNLSDGGHFENLGLYEMVLRRCQRIVVIDAGRDTEFVFEDLGNAIRKIRIDFGIRVEIVTSFLEPNKKGMHLARCVVGKIHYEEVDENAPAGKLLYIKPLLQKDEPVDVRNYAAAHPGFPHETTNDQWFSESQLESYRMLACHSMEEILSGAKATPTIDEFFQHVETQSAAIEASLKKEKVRVVRLEG